MKRHILFCICAWLAVSVNAQSIKDRKVPEPVKKTVMDLYPSATKIEWEMEDGMYEADFDQDGTEISVHVSLQGALAMIKVAINPAELPEGVLDFLQGERQDISSIEAARITNAIQSVSFEVETGDSEYLFDERGRFLSRQVEEEEEDEHHR